MFYYVEPDYEASEDEIDGKDVIQQVCALRGWSCESVIRAAFKQRFALVQMGAADYVVSLYERYGLIMKWVRSYCAHVLETERRRQRARRPGRLVSDTFAVRPSRAQRAA